LWAAELPRAAWTVASLAFAGATLRDAPHGDGRPVMVLPGLFNSDLSNAAMRRYLRSLGYRAHGWKLGRNLGARTIGSEGWRLFDRIEALAAEDGQPVTLIGVSLGGMMARLAAHRMPHAVREIITVASPYAGSPRATNVWRAFELITGERIDSVSVASRSAEIARPLPVPATAIWSASDGLVSGLICHAPDEPNCRAIRIDGSHMGVQFRPRVLRAIADVLGGGSEHTR
jgi:triacylglycerol lipase